MLTQTPDGGVGPAWPVGRRSLYTRQTQSRTSPPLRCPVFHPPDRLQEFWKGPAYLPCASRSALRWASFFWMNASRTSSTNSCWWRLSIHAFIAFVCSRHLNNTPKPAIASHLRNSCTYPSHCLHTSFWYSSNTCFSSFGVRIQLGSPSIRFFSLSLSNHPMLACMFR